MAKQLISDKELIDIINKVPAEMPKKVYAEPKKPEPKKQIDRPRLESDLNDLLYSAGGQAPGYRRQLNKILDQYL